MNQIYIAPTYRCNNRCLMCGVFNTKKDSYKEYSLEEVIHKMDEHNIVKGDIVVISGGEPTIYRYFFDILEYLEAKKARIIIFSNGRLFKDNNFVNRMKDYNYENMLIPLFGSTSEIHDGFTSVQGSFKDTYQGLCNLDNKGLRYSIKTVVMKGNYKDLPVWAKFISETFHNIFRISIHGLHLQGEAGKIAKQLYVSHKEGAPYIEQALEILERKEIDIAISAFPLCVLDPVYWKYNITSNLAEYTALSDDSEKIRETNIKNYRDRPLVCDKCRIQAKCEWPWRMYEKLFSLDYLHQI